MRRWQIFAVICILALALGVGYFLHNGAITGQPAHPDALPVVNTAATSVREADAANSITHEQLMHHANASAAPLPPPGTPLKGIYDELKARADAGDAAAASRLFHDVRTCFAVNRIETRIVPLVPRILGTVPAGASVPDLKNQDSMLESFQQLIDFAASNQSLCAGLDKEQRAGIAPLALRAARLGDMQAADCYIAMDISLMPDLLDHPEWLTQYKQNALDLANAAIQRGDWAIVELLEQAYTGALLPDELIVQLVNVNPTQRYRYLKLEQLGSRGDVAARVNEKLAFVSKQLTPNQIANADGWAQDVYARYYNGRDYSGSSNTTNICGIEGY